MIEDSFVVRGPRILNAIWRELRDFRGSLLTFKRKLDVFLGGLPEKPSPKYYQSAAGNGLMNNDNVERLSVNRLFRHAVRS